MEDAWDITDTGALHPGKSILGEWGIACDQHLDDLRRETGALQYPNVRPRFKQNATANKAASSPDVA
jgi:hypothetical protein